MHKKKMLMIKTKKSPPTLSLEKKFQDPGIRLEILRVKCKTAETERMQSANKAWLRDPRIYKSKDVPWRVKCRSMVDQSRTLRNGKHWRGYWDGGKKEDGRSGCGIVSTPLVETWITISKIAVPWPR